MTKLKVGDTAPSFKDIPDGKGNLHSLENYAGKILVLYFYPKSFTPGCTKQACEFRDKYEAFSEAGAVVIGVSSDSQDSQSKFQDKYRLPFPILSDNKGELAKLYGVEKELLILPGRTTFIIDKDQKIAHTYTNMFKATSHIDESLKIIEKLK
ncbi:hypothetical protein DICPUDRAFT_92295 [Dictyostelium purpureum]|uniref:thioredoxin-dependent peroxiredoxin n=1 Tax=Dictyostelium purpureum TaxID=5786 RepID=F0ZPS5_DICPU|nr:uncharacterized protein DICPUDRAFT_92295 [Dictyostelium purpureum]EGC34060.1 hypothetical protein DICPUDRAFT_92295 [Dictyostelium purpureum]|eukprot:XP_003289424.1 hypothetical protein DICPUDRAFT_92295 [Dictyostelium purpureum]